MEITVKSVIKSILDRRVFWFMPKVTCAYALIVLLLMGAGYLSGGPFDSFLVEVVSNLLALFLCGMIVLPLIYVYFQVLILGEKGPREFDDMGPAARGQFGSFISFLMLWIVSVYILPRCFNLPISIHYELLLFFLCLTILSQVKYMQDVWPRRDGEE